MNKVELEEGTVCAVTGGLAKTVGGETSVGKLHREVAIASLGKACVRRDMCVCKDDLASRREVGRP